MKFLLAILLIYLLIRLIRNVRVFTMRTGLFRQADPEPPAPPARQNKIIAKDEGEYVDYEDLKD